MITELLKALMLIFVAEMGDKTQILAMAFATRFPIKKVLLGIGIGSLLNHGLAVLLGNVLTRVIPINTIQMMAGMAFVTFSLWTLKSDDYDEEDEVTMKFGPTATVAIAFFLGELGDKTQLTAVTLAIDANHPLIILTGTVIGMMVTGAIGILIGKTLGDKIPELAIKIIASSIFMGFGILKLYETLPAYLLKEVYVLPVGLVIGLIMAMMIRTLFVRRREGIVSDYNMKSKVLHDYYEHIHKDLEALCHIVEVPDDIDQADKLDSHYMAIKVEEQLNQLTEIRMRYRHHQSGSESFSIDQVLDSLVDTLWVIDHVKMAERLSYAHQIRRELERILIGSACLEYASIEDYINYMKEKDAILADKIYKIYRLRKPIEDRIINLGSQSNNIYLIEIEEGYILIDTGLKEKYNQFCEDLASHRIELSEISYVFITHAHKDHVGFLKDILDATDAKVILHPQTVSKLKRGENSFKGGFSNIFAFIFFRIKRLLTGKSHRFDVIDDATRYIVVSEENQAVLENILPAKVLDLPGHTNDSIGIIIDKSVLFCGDAAVNNITGQYRIIHWIESVIDYKKSWHKMIESDLKMVYPTHGKPFSKEELIKYQCKLHNVKLR